jgi:putative nucleotidyltransferase with HDIG domain
MKVRTTVAAGDACTEEYLPIGLETLSPVPVLDFDLYVPIGNPGGVVLYREKNYRLERQDLDQLQQNGLRTLYISAASQTAYHRYLFDTAIKNTGMPPVQRFQVLTTVTRSAFDAAFRSISPDHVCRFAGEFGKHLVDVVCDPDFALFDLLSLLKHDYHTYTHTVNVAACAAALAHTLGNYDADALRQIAAGAMLHDVGKRRLPRELLNRPTPLSRREKEIFREHPKIAFEELSMREDQSWQTLMMVYQHHERADGKGYPVGIAGDEIHEWARICSICDVFDMLRADRSLHGLMRLRDIAENMERRAGRDFDEEMVRCWTSTIRQKR